MKLELIFFSLSSILFFGCGQPKESSSNSLKDSLMQKETVSPSFQQGYATVNGLKMYYEMHGNGQPLVLIHGGGSTINTTFGKILPIFAKTYKVIAVELQAHGRTADRKTPTSFKQDASDIVELLNQLHISKASFLGFSNGGQTAMQLAMSYPEKVNKLILASMFYKRDATPAAFWEGMALARLVDMPQVYKDEFLKVNNDSAALLAMFNRDANRMRAFKDWKDEDLRAITAPTLIVIGDQDLPRPEHAVEMHLLISNSRLAILPGNHGSYMGEIMSSDQTSKVPELFVAMVDEFLSQKMSTEN